MTRKLQCYHLSESLPLKYAFLGSNVTWFLQTHVILSDVCHVSTREESPKHNEAEVGNLDSGANVVTDSVELGVSSSEKRTKCKRKKVKVRRFPYLKASLLKISTASSFHRKRKRKNVKKKPKTGCPRRGRMQRSLAEKEMLCQFATGAEVNLSKMSDSNVTEEAAGEMVSEPASVSGIIKKYFSDYDEVASSPELPFTTVRYKRRKQLSRGTGCEYPSMLQCDVVMSPVTVRTPPHVSQDARVVIASPREKLKMPEVGKRLLLALNSLGLTPSSRRPILSLCRYYDADDGE